MNDKSLNNSSPILCTLFSLLLISGLFSQDLPVIYALPFESSSAEKNISDNTFYYFRSRLSASGRVKLFSEGAWQKIIKTHRLILKLNDITNTQKIMELGRITQVDRLVTGTLKKSNGLFTLTIDWINLQNGLIEKTLSYPGLAESAINSTIEAAMKDLTRLLIKNGRIRRIKDKTHVEVELPSDAGWIIGDEFLLINDFGFSYGRSRIYEISAQVASAECFALQERVRIGDELCYHDNYSMNTKPLPRALLMPITSDLDVQLGEVLFAQARQLIIRSGKFETIDETMLGEFYEKAKTYPNSSYIFQLKILSSDVNQIFLVNLSVKDIMTDIIRFETNIECLDMDITHAVTLALMDILNKWELNGFVARNDGEAIMIDLGSNQNIHAQQNIIFKDGQSGSIIAEAKIDEVYLNQSVIKDSDLAAQLRVGCIASVCQPNQSHTELSHLRKKIDDEVTARKTGIQQNEIKKREMEMAQRNLEQLSKLPKSRIKAGYGKPKFSNSSETDVISDDLSHRSFINVYLGNHPYAQIALNYNYLHIRKEDSPDIIYWHAVGLGGRLQVPIWNPMVVYVESFAQYAQIHNLMKKDNVLMTAQSRWKGLYLQADAGLEIPFNKSVSIFAQGGLLKKLESEQLDLGCYFMEAGLGIWF